ncbi:helix-turn-helix domain-containing protein [Streptomyces sp. NPDC006645]|uniref:TetR/AcrR family transcriptional regulator n=1 Tax=unclassified Streptomyces TaxID=2593676 RepID=UPI0033B71087
MGHREDLLEGAKRCLLEKGYTRTTARDIVAASGANLASIGYHYGSKEALLNEAFIAVTEQWGDRVTEPHAADGADGADGAADGSPGETATAPGPARDGAPPASLDHFRDVWAKVVASHEESRPLWQLQMEVVSRVGTDAGLQKALADKQLEGRDGLAEGMFGVDRKDDPEKARVVGLFTQALLAGVMVQWMVDPETAPSAQDLTDGLRAIIGDDLA